MKVPTGKGVFLWQLEHCFGGNMTALATKLYEGNFQWVTIKATDYTYPFNQSLLPSAIEELRLRDIAVWGWGYTYGVSEGKAAEEALKAVKAVNDYGFEGWMIDAEREYERQNGEIWAESYIQTFKGELPDTSVGLCASRWPSVHEEFPWKEFLSGCDFHIPQVYWMGAHNPAEQLARSYRELIALKNLPYIPVGAAFYEELWTPTVNEINIFNAKAQEMKLPGICWWAWDESGGIGVRPDFFSAIKAHTWVEVPPPPEDKGIQFEVITDALNVRTKPTTSAPIVDLLLKGDVRTPLDIGGDTVWIKIGDNQWCAVKYNGKPLMQLKAR